MAASHTIRLIISFTRPENPQPSLAGTKPAQLSDVLRLASYPNRI
jgi:hypothetical protein